jgi:hypothetical protein
VRDAPLLPDNTDFSALCLKNFRISGHRNPRFASRHSVDLAHETAMCKYPVNLLYAWMWMAVQIHDVLAESTHLFLSQNVSIWLKLHIISILESLNRSLITYFNQTRSSTDNRGSRSVLSRRPPFTSSMASWFLGRACAAAPAAMESNLLLSHLPTTTAIAPEKVTAGCASTIPLTNAENPGRNMMLPTITRRSETMDTNFGCLAIR